MPDDLSAEDLATIVEQIDRGEDAFQVPEDLLQEPEIPVPAPPEEINQSLFTKIMRMTVGERIKLALKGNRDARSILMRDSNRLIPRLVLQNPRISDDEIVAIGRNRNADAELLRVIGDDREWAQNPQIRSVLVTNPKTPVGVALKFIKSLPERELRQLAKSKNITSAVATAAKRTLFLKTEKRS